jgi:hypothetical protein
MSTCEALLEKARNNPGGLRFAELCSLAECFGWVFNRVRGSHHIYKRSAHIQAMNFQDFKGFAKAYQVKQLIRAIDSLPSTE